MKILVAVKRVVDANVKVRVKSDGSDVDLANVKMAVNPFDEIALEAAVRLKEAGVAGEVIAVSIGPEAVQDTLRMALAMGADRAIRVAADVACEPLAVARMLAELARRDSVGLVLLGKQAIDDDCSQTGQMLSALTGWPQATCASAIEVSDAQATVTCEVDGGLETVSLELPAVVTADLRLNAPRYVTLPSLMKAKKKPMDTISAESLGIDLAPGLEVLALREPAPRLGGRRVSHVAALVSVLAPFSASAAHQGEQV
ncbi:electron transfer flavoprotein subunit beta/FixA family protein [Burkholderia contaminans]|uniref:Electron transfer flavoprotein subunit beta n=1 Tax=Burkholderia contaminans TaxID=488447 RepID=A0A3N8PTW3_9BURK|nr:electron transfer flavoprotein subunit beta/FixA family protein [Burkholderia contaminans]RQT15047.1 electron transfer flavoprotein subunit beta/FixA family protein [Burkholderia contaminans]